MTADLITVYETMKTALVPANQDLRALVHIHVGLAIWLGLVVVWRRGMAALLPICAVVLACLVNEGFDLASHWPVQHGWIWRDTAGDLFNTLLWPVLIWLYACWSARRPREAEPPPSGG